MCYLFIYIFYCDICSIHMYFFATDKINSFLFIYKGFLIFRTVKQGLPFFGLEKNHIKQIEIEYKTQFHELIDFQIFKNLVILQERFRNYHHL